MENRFFSLLHRILIKESYTLLFSTLLVITDFSRFWLNLTNALQFFYLLQLHIEGNNDRRHSTPGTVIGFVTILVEIIRSRA